MVSLSLRYDLREEAQGNWSVIDHWINDRYDREGSIKETGLTEQPARGHWQKLTADDTPRIQAQLERIYRQDGMLPETK